jgi:uncharacterized protein with PIN domain
VKSCMASEANLQTDFLTTWEGNEMMCPDCKIKLEHTDEKMSESGELYEVKVYKCPKCEVEFDEDELD